MSQSRIVEMLSTRIGLEPRSLGANALPGIIAAGMRAHELDNHAAYAALLESSPAAFEELVQDVVVPETWFFRGGRVFSFLAEHVRKTSASRPLDRPFRILSVPCSTGEEPYSLVIALTEADVPRTRWTVDAVDISPRNLERARRGYYSAFSFRETSEERRSHYFRPLELGWEIAPALREAVRFQQGNVLDPHFLANAQPFDLIFCRNLLIYFHEAARVQIATALDRLLVPGGWLCLGHAEPQSLPAGRFRSTGSAAFFLLERIEETRRDRKDSISQRPVLRDAPPRRTRAPRVVEPAQAVAVLPALDPLAAARRAADAGNLALALASCQEQLNRTEASADLYSLMGVIQQARREDTAAAACFRKALYLDPDHEEALTHLMLLLQQGGDEPAAALLRRRLARKSAGGSA